MEASHPARQPVNCGFRRDRLSRRRRHARLTNEELGARLPRVDELFEKTKTTVEATLKKLGLDPAAALLKQTGDLATYTLMRGSAAVLVSVVHRPEQKAVFLRVASPVLVPAADKREGLYKRLLELNAGGLANAAFGLLNDMVVAVSERPAENLDPGEVEQIIRHLSAVADTYDDRLVKEFGGQRAADARSKS